MHHIELLNTEEDRMKLGIGWQGIVYELESLLSSKYFLEFFIVFEISIRNEIILRNRLHVDVYLWVLFYFTCKIQEREDFCQKKKTRSTTAVEPQHLKVKK